MTHWVQLAAIPLAVLALLTLAAAIAAVVRKPLARCCALVSWLDLLHWLGIRSGGCGYDLAGLAEVEGKVRCPECGTVQRRRVRRPNVLRRSACVLVFGAAGLCCWKVLWFRYGHWAKFTPTIALIWLDNAPMPGRVESVLEDRLNEGSVPRWERERLAALAVRHLGRPYDGRNVTWASRVLFKMGREPVPRLEAALYDKDRQRREGAATLLQSRCQRAPYECGPPEPYVPPDALFSVTIQMLDGSPLHRYYTGDSIDFLLDHWERAQPFLSGALRDRSEGAFGCALLVGFLGEGRLAEQAAPVLASHLKHNDLEGDARDAAPAILGLGEAGRACLAPLINGDEAQARELAWIIVKTMDHQPLSVGDQRALMHVTDHYQDLRVALEEERKWLRER